MEIINTIGAEIKSERESNAFKRFITIKIPHRVQSFAVYERHNERLLNGVYFKDLASAVDYMSSAKFQR